MFNKTFFTSLALLSLLADQRLSADELAVLKSKPMTFVGVASCTATNCHGGRGKSGGEATHWLQFDAKHRQAFDVLLSDRSRSMAVKLGIREAHTDSRCLACHTTNAGKTNVAHGERFSLEFGVGCEACHGPAGDWLSAHTQKSWRTLSDLQKAELGFRDLQSATNRADACAVCHVGSESATVDHDLIAAGHPRLTFELAAYHSMLPKHWNAREELQRDPMQEVRLWAIGQATTAKVTTEISRARAQAALDKQSDRVATDLAEFDCHSCHHDLAEESWRVNRWSLGKLGAPQWGTWNVYSAVWLAKNGRLPGANLSDAGVETSFIELQKLMQSSRLGTVRAEPLLMASRQANAALRRWQLDIESAKLDQATVKDLQRLLLLESSDNEWLPTWDGYAQRLLAISAVNSATHATGNNTLVNGNPISSPLLPLRERLRYPRDYATPHRLIPAEVDELFRQLRP